MNLHFVVRRQLIICDPNGDLEKAYEEGDRIRAELDRRPIMIRTDLFNGAVDAVTLKEYLRGYDIIHYAGHATYDPDNPAESGWLMHDSAFTAGDIAQLSQHLPLPALVFSNACQSGQTGARGASRKVLSMTFSGWPTPFCWPACSTMWAPSGRCLTNQAANSLPPSTAASFRENPSAAP